MRRRTRFLLSVFLVIVMVTVAAAACFLSRERPLPSPNGYDDLVKAAILARYPRDDAPAFDHDGLKALLSQNAEALRFLHIGLSRECVVPTDVATTNRCTLWTASRDFFLLSGLLNNEGFLAEMEGRYGDAARSHLDAIRMGQAVSRGGLTLSITIGINCERASLSAFGKLMPRLSFEETRPLITELVEIDGATIPWGEVQRNEFRYAINHLSPGFHPIEHVRSLWAHKRMVHYAEVPYKEAVARLRLLTVELALHCHQVKHGRAPASLQQLVPEYFQHLPMDPFSGQPLVYRMEGTNCLLYSVGKNGVDDGGQSPMRMEGAKNRDLFLHLY